MLNFKAITSGKYPEYLQNPFIPNHIAVLCGLKGSADGREPHCAKQCTSNTVKSSNWDIWEATGNSTGYNKSQNGRTRVGTLKE